MSRIGKVPVSIPAGVKVNVSGSEVKVVGKLGSLEFTFPSDVAISVEDSKVVLKPANDTTRARAMWGLSRSLLQNMVKGTSEGFSLKLEITGVGYRAAVDKNMLTLLLGFSHEIKYAIPQGIEIKYDNKANVLEIVGIEKQKIGQVAAEIMRLRPSEPYKGKGIRIAGSIIRRKAGKKK